MTGNRPDADLIAEIWRHPGRPVRAVIDLDAIAANVRAIRETLSPGTRFMAVVKANGYGHGATAVVRTALEAGASCLGVATVSEGVRLRSAGIAAPILVMGPADPEEFPRAAEYGLEIAIGSAQSLAAARRVGEAIGRRLPVHLKLDTGMHRFGANPSELDALLAEAVRGGIVFRGLFSHFACADEPQSNMTDQQAATFAGMHARVLDAGLKPELVHLANSAATLRCRTWDFDLVRVGIALYGLNPSSDVALLPEMRPAMSLLARVRRVSTLAPGESVSYGCTYTSSGHESVALLPLGYADGYHRLISNRGWVRLGNQDAYVRGRVCMDQMVAGIPGLSDSWSEGITTGVFGPLGGGPSIDMVATWAGTINYEIATSVAARVPRFYLQSGKVVAIDDDAGYHTTT